jgi:hypothetical protein
MEEPLPKARFKKKAHLFTLLSVVWVFFSLFGLFFWSQYFRFHTDVADLIAAVLLWVLQVLFVVLAVLFWFHEKPTEYEQE